MLYRQQQEQQVTGGGVWRQDSEQSADAIMKGDVLDICCFTSFRIITLHAGHCITIKHICRKVSV